MRDHTKLIVWQRSQAFAAELYKATQPARNRHPELFWQLHRAIGSIGANIAEGAAQPTRRQYARYLGIAHGSAQEALSHLDVVRRLGLLAADNVSRIIAELREIRAMLYALRMKVLKEI